MRVPTNLGSVGVRECRGRVYDLRGLVSWSRVLVNIPFSPDIICVDRPDLSFPHRVLGRGRDSNGETPRVHPENRKELKSKVDISLSKPRPEDIHVMFHY